MLYLGSSIILVGKFEIFNQLSSPSLFCLEFPSVKLIRHIILTPIDVIGKKGRLATKG